MTEAKLRVPTVAWMMVACSLPGLAGAADADDRRRPDRAQMHSARNESGLALTISTNGFIVTQRGRTGGARLARPPSEITVGAIVRMAEKDFAVVSCHDLQMADECAILEICNVRHGFRRAVDAFLAELDGMTLDQAIKAPRGKRAGGPLEIRVPLPDPSNPRRAPAAAGRRPQPSR